MGARGNDKRLNLAFAKMINLANVNGLPLFYNTGNIPEYSVHRIVKNQPNKYDGETIRALAGKRGKKSAK